MVIVHPTPQGQVTVDYCKPEKEYKSFLYIVSLVIAAINSIQKILLETVGIFCKC